MTLNTKNCLRVLELISLSLRDLSLVIAKEVIMLVFTNSLQSNILQWVREAPSQVSSRKSLETHSWGVEGQVALEINPYLTCLLQLIQLIPGINQETQLGSGEIRRPSTRSKNASFLEDEKNGSELRMSNEPKKRPKSSFNNYKTQSSIVKKGNIKFVTQ